MDMNDFWQENKRFLLWVASGLFVFFLGMILIDRFVGADLRAKRADLRRAQEKLRLPKFQASDLASARSENEDLRRAVGKLARAVSFRPRDDFLLGEEGTGASNRYFAVVARVREDLMTLAGRSELSIPPNLGLPPLAPTRAPEIARHLEALDVIDRAVRLAVDAGVARIDEIRIQLDPAFVSGRGFSAIERTRVAFKMTGPSAPLVKWLAYSQEPREGMVLLIDQVELQTSRTKADEARLDLVLVVSCLHGVDFEPDEPPEDES